MTTNQYSMGVPILNQPYLDINDLEITVASNTTLSVGTGIARDSTNSFDIPLNAVTTLNMAVQGVNGLDTGTFAEASQYYIYLIADPTLNNVPAVIASLSNTVPFLPQGYSIYRWIGFEQTAGGSAAFLARYVTGNGNVRKHYWDAPISVLSGGTATSATAVDLAGAIPTSTQAANILPVLFDVSFTPASAGDKVTLVPGGSSSTTGASLSAVAVHAQTGQLTVAAVQVSNDPQIKYINSASSGSTTLLVQGFEYYL